MAHIGRDPARDAPSREDVVAAYRLILGREPEDEATVLRHVRSGLSVAGLRRAFLDSAEFRDALGAGAHPPAVMAGAGEVAAPLAAAAPDDDARPAVDSYRLTAERCGVDVTRLQRCLALGCGEDATAWLAGLHREVVAVDVPRLHGGNTGHGAPGGSTEGGALAVLRDVRDLERVGRFDAFFCPTALGRLPSHVMEVVLGAVLARLEPGGVAFFRVPTHGADRQAATPGGSWKVGGVLPQREVFRVVRDGGCAMLEVLTDAAADGDGPAGSVFLVRKAREAQGSAPLRPRPDWKLSWTA